jgi:HK97 family phage major capsid protein
MTELKMIKELLSTGTGTEGSLLIPKKIFSTLIEEVEKALIPRSEAALFLGPGDIPGSSIDINLVTANSSAVRLVAEGTEIPLDNDEYTSFNVKPDKYGVTIRITREMMEDSQFNLLQQNIRKMGRRFADNENSLIISQALDNANTTVSGGAAITISDITEGQQALEDEDYEATSYFIGTEVLNDLRNIDTFVEANKVGNTDMIKKGFQGVIYGMNVMKVSPNAGMTKTTSFITDKQHAYGLFVKREMTLENYDLEQFDMSAASITMRLRARHIRAKAIAKITTT